MEKGIVKELVEKMPQTGKVTVIAVRKERKVQPTSLSAVLATSEAGLEGDHFSSSYSKKRQVTLIQQEHLDTVKSIMKMDVLDPMITRRNIVVEGINLLALKDQKFRIGTVIMQGTGYCHPCSRMEESLGEGGYNAMRGHGGITAEILEDGEILVGSEVRHLPS